jgi:BolA family transcriptional regulator, general stress-responsive regulator
MRTKLESIFAPIRLSILDESSLHASHAGAVRADGGVGETHFRIEIVSAAFAGMNRVTRERAVQQALSEEFDKGLHALSVKALTPNEGE